MKSFVHGPLHVELIGIKCQDPGTPENGNKDKDTFGYDAVVTFSCDPGYTRVGQKSIICLNTGHWSGRRPQCERQ